ncbi:MAG: hypothetical protein HYV13_04195 [Candidatus Doudnabacteria bacterium]|nr:hypothetical protein [Candidatus Doudnabacteria bacterium]
MSNNLFNFNLDQIYVLYNQFLSYFPPGLHGLISLVLAGLIVVGILKVIKKDFIYIILLVVLVPAALPILKTIWQSLSNIIKFLLTKG